MQWFLHYPAPVHNEADPLILRVAAFCAWSFRILFIRRSSLSACSKALLICAGTRAKSNASPAKGIKPIAVAHHGSSRAESTLSASLANLLDRFLLTIFFNREVIDGQIIQVSPANPSHADRTVDISYVLRANVAPNYVASTDLLTRISDENDFATDVCIRKAGTDAQGHRHLEELSFEVKYTQVLGKPLYNARRGPDSLCRATTNKARAVSILGSSRIRHHCTSHAIDVWYCHKPSLPAPFPACNGCTENS